VLVACSVEPDAGTGRPRESGKRLPLSGKVSAREFADRAGVSRPTVANYLAGWAKAIAAGAPVPRRPSWGRTTWAPSRCLTDCRPIPLQAEFRYRRRATGPGWSVSFPPDAPTPGDHPGMATNEALRTWTDDSVWRSGPAAFRALRTMRAKPPGAAGRGERADMFRSALEQAQQQITAARSVGYESRPLNLFYGLSQAGRAIAAAAPGLRNEGRGTPWDLKGHGIKAVGIDNVTASNFPSMRLRRDGKGMGNGGFATVADVLGGSGFTEGAAISQLWATIVEAGRDAQLIAADHSVLTVWPHHLGLTEPGTAHTLAEPAVCEVSVYGPPIGREHLTQGHELLDGGNPDLVAFNCSPEYIRRVLQPYPTLQDYRIESQIDQTHRAGTVIRTLEFSVLVSIFWPLPPDARDSSMGLELVLNERTNDYRGRRVCLPEFHPQTGVLHPLLTWWAILFGLSMLCRYRPTVWTQLIDINQSPYGSAIEHLLDVGLDAVPDLVERTIRQVTV
jgi:hypothetical protein